MWQPRGNTVFIRKAAPKTMTEGGIVLPNEQVGLTLEGEVVVSGGPNLGHFLPGTRVLFSKFAGSEVTVNGESLLILMADDILATWQGE